MAVVANVDEAEQVLEVLPAGIGDRRETGYLARVANRIRRKQLPVFAERNENHAIEQALGHFNRGFDRVAFFVAQVAD